MTSIPDHAEESTSQTTNLNSKDVLLAAAREAYERGWSVIPANSQKEAIVKWTQYQSKRISIEELERQIKRPHVSILGLVTGQVSGLFALDTDDKKALEFCKSLGLEPHTRSQGGGYHSGVAPE